MTAPFAVMSHFCVHADMSQKSMSKYNNYAYAATQVFNELNETSYTTLEVATKVC